MQIAEQIERAEDLRRKNPGLSLTRSLELALTLPLPAPPEEVNPEAITAAEPDDGVEAFVYIPDLQFETAPEHRHALRLALNSTPGLPEAIRAALEPVLREHLGPVFRAEIANPSAPSRIRITRALLADADSPGLGGTVHAPASVTVENAKGTPRFKLTVTGAPFTNNGRASILDFAGMPESRDSLPVLLDCDTSRIVGFTENLERTPEGVTVSGVLATTTPEADRVAGLARDGFPWSGAAILAAAEILDLPPDHTAVVNGKEVSGPLLIVRRWNLRAVSFTTIDTTQPAPSR